MKRTTKVLVFILLAFFLAVGMTFAGGEKEGAAASGGASFVPAAQIKAPAGKPIIGLPVDQVSKKQIRIATIMVQNNPFGMAVMEGTLFAKEILKDRNVKVDWISVPDFDPQKFESAMQNVITAQYDAVTLFGLSEALQPVVDKAMAEGIKVYSFNTEPGLKSKRIAFWGQDGFWGGQKCGNLLMDAVGGKGKYAIITGSFNVLGHELRRTGARDVLDKNPNMKLIGEFENQDKAEEAYNITQNLLTSNPDIAAIYVTAGGPFGAAKAIKDAGLTGKVKLICHDWMKETVEYVRSGEVTAVLDQDPFNQGYAPVIAAFNHIMTGKPPAKEINWFEGDVATPADVAKKIPQ
ncbi:MAG: sugar ABC transporter substrate-binding protein [Spirochaetales bacterium]|nr:MAG: sugar ABC transporter substrate-binding protein [Spirochaetales bacterium]